MPRNIHLLHLEISFCLHYPVILMRLLLVLLGHLLLLPSASGQGSKGRSELMQRAHTLYAVDSLEAALAYYKKVAYDVGQEDTPVLDSLSGYALHRMGVCAQYLGKTNEAVRYYRTATSVRDATFHAPHNERAKSRSNLAYLYKKTGLLDSAAIYLNAAASLLEAVPATHTDVELYAITLTDLVEVAYGLGDSQMATVAAQRAYKVLKDKHSEISIGLRAKMHYSISRALTYLDQYIHAELHLSEASILYGELEDNFELAKSFQLAAVIADRQNYPIEAIHQLQLALNYAPPDNPQLLSYIHHALARQYLRLRDFAAAETNLRAAEAEAPPGDRIHSDNAKVRARLLAATNQPTAALAYFNKAIALLISSGTYVANILTVEPTTVNEGQLDLLALHLTDRAAFLANQDRPKEALRDYETVLQLRERLRRDVSSRSSRERLSTNLRPILDRAIDLCYRLYSGGEQEMGWQALQYSEWARAYDLLRSYHRGGGPSQKPAGSESELRARIARLERRVTTDTTLRPELTDAQLRLDRLVRQQNIRDTAALQLLERDRLQDYLARQQLDLVAYHLTDSLGYRFALSVEGHLAFDALPVGPHLTEQVTAWQSSIAAAAYRRKSVRPTAEQTALDREFVQRGQALVQCLQLSSSQRPTVYLPDGILHYLPFAALPLGNIANGKLDYGTISYLGDHAPLSFGYSIATLLAQEAAPTTDYTTGLLALAPTFTGGGLPPLPLGTQEVTAVADHCDDAQLFLDKAANRTNFLQHAPTARILHLSTHGRANLEQPNLSYVAFTQTGDTTDLDERLYYNELGALRLPAELVILSACETSIGKPVPGETVASLATAFASAGAHSTVTTLWQVDERATLELLDAFYGRLAAGDGRQLALYEAQQELRRSKDYAHPYYWAGLALHGSVAPLDIRSPAAPPYGWWVAVVLVAALAYLWYRRKSFSFAGQTK